MAADFMGESEIPWTRTLAALNRGIASKWHHGAQLFVSRSGKVLADLAVGESEPGRKLEPDDMMLWLSSGKPLTAYLVMLMAERGQLSLDDPVCRHVPEFSFGGKEDITLRHCLTHTGGFGIQYSGWPHQEWDTVIEQICGMKPEPDWVPGVTAGYHAASSWYILAELLQRIDGRRFPTLVRREIFDRLLMNRSFCGMSEAEHTQFQKSLVPMFNRWRGAEERLAWHDQMHCRAVSPGGNSRGPARELGRFYECLLASLPDCREMPRQGILHPERAVEFISRHRSGQYDQTFRHTIDFGLGCIIDSNQYGVDTVPYGFSPYCSPRTFGHGGNQSSIGFADPVQQLVVVVVTNGMPGEPRHQQRNRMVNSAIYEDLGLAT